MTALRQIPSAFVVAALCSGPAFALTPRLPCVDDGSQVENRPVDYVNPGPKASGAVVYSTSGSSGRHLVYLEHCPSGQILRARSGPRSLTNQHPRHPDNVSGDLNNAMFDDRRTTLKAFQADLRAKGVASKRYTSKAESCACLTYFPEAIGTKTPYKEDTK